MAEFKLVISDPKTGKSVQRELKDAPAEALAGKKIKDTFKGEIIDLPGYEFEITGGSDSAGFPMRWDVQGATRKRITAVKGVGVSNKLRKPNPKKKGWRTIEGMRLKKTVAGNTIHAKTAQINLKILKIGKEKLFGDEEPEAKAEGDAPAAAPKKEGGKKMEEEKAKESPEDVKEEVDTVPEKTEEVTEKVEEVSLKGEEEQISVSDPTAPEEKSEETPAEETKEDEESDKLMEDVDKLDEEIAKDEEELKKEDEEIEKIEEELKDKSSEETEKKEE